MTVTAFTINGALAAAPTVENHREDFHPFFMGLSPK
jgi:hypothetical protein